MSYRLLTDDMAAFAQALDIQKPLIFGFSDGGQVALEPIIGSCPVAVQTALIYWSEIFRAATCLITGSPSGNLKGKYGMLITQWFWIRLGILGLCWGLFCTVWLIGAIYNFFKAPIVQKRSGPIYPWIAGIAAFAIGKWFLPQRFWALVTFDTLWIRVIGTICLLLATAFTLWARWVLGKMWSSSPVARVGHQLRTDGPYRMSRHPIYTGMLGMLFGTMLMSGLGFYTLIFLLGIMIFEIKLHQEEGLLRETFGDEYVHYQQRVPQLIPGLKRRKGDRKGA